MQPGWTLPLQKIRLAKNRFLQGGKGGQNTKEKSRQLLKTGFFREVKIQKKNPGNALEIG
jgi:hypothetical protein